MEILVAILWLAAIPLAVVVGIFGLILGSAIILQGLLYVFQFLSSPINHTVSALTRGFVKPNLDIKPPLRLGYLPNGAKLNT